MRNILILVGSPGAGKSTWIQENNLEKYTIAPDNLRMLYSAPELQTDGSYGISQKNDKAVRNLLYALVEERMKKGMFTIIDATHTRQKYLNSYKKLAEQYRYRTYVKVFEKPLEVLLKQNRQRDIIKQVPNEVIELHYERLKLLHIPSGFTQIQEIHETNEFVKYNDMSSYEGILFIGDIHGCYDTLMEGIEKFNNDKILYVFCGDYIDRGDKSGETMLFMQEMIKRPNVICIEGNHERRLWERGNETYQNIRSKVFKNDTIPQLTKAGYTQKMAREFYRKLRPFVAIIFHGQKYLITHGGVSTPNIDFISTEQLIKGVADYGDLDQVYSSYNKQNEVIQIHGHRNVQGYEVMSQYPSINLEQGVDQGEYMGFYYITKEKSMSLCVPSTLPRPQKESKDIVVTALSDMEAHKFVVRKDLGDDIFSWNFSSKAFYEGVRDSITTKARGLFTDAEGKVLARSYNKFFNIGERDETGVRSLEKREGNFIGYEKYNGYLGIFSTVRGEPMFFSKSTNQGWFAERFKELAYNLINVDALCNYSQETNTSLIFEVIDPFNDPHIIDENECKLVLLDIVSNDMDGYKMPYATLRDVANKIGVLLKKISIVSAPRKDIGRVINALSQKEIEGYVFEGEDGFMVKYKTPYYNTWKKMRGYMNRINSGKMQRFTDTFEKELLPIVNWYMQLNAKFDNVVSLRKEWLKHLSSKSTTDE